MSARLLLGVAMVTLLLVAVGFNANFTSTYSTFTDTSTGSQTVKAATNFVPALCQPTHSTLAGWNIIKGTNANNTITGTNGDDLIWALGGNDTVNAGGGSDCVVGGDGVDTLNGGNQNDILIGGNGNDGLNGENGNDTLDGGDGTDTCNGGNGNGDSAVNCESTSNVP
jgi:Ca2+-binding RTX toxin-like protein